MSTRSRRRSSRNFRWIGILVALVIAAIVLVLMAPSLIVGWVRGYVQEDAFKTKMEAFLGTKLNGAARLAPLRWTGNEVTSVEAQVTTAGGWQAEMNGLRLALDWNAFRGGAWRLVGAGADSLDLQYQPALAGTAAASAPVEEVETLREPTGGSGGDAPAWLRRWLPTRTEIEGVAIDHFSLTHPAGWKVRESRVRVSPWHQEPSCQTTIEGGHLETPLRIPSQPTPLKFNLVRASTRISREQILLNEATLQWLDPAEITVRGSLQPQGAAWKLSAHIAGVPMRECVTEDWRTRLAGSLEGDLTGHGSAAATPTIEGDLQLRDGVLTALPILDRLATYTGVERFKRLVLDIATTHVHHDASGTRFEKVVLQSNGLMRIEGTLVVRDRQIEGDFVVGVTQDTLRWFPGAQQHVFTLSHPGGPPGLLWTTLKISGTLDAPREDLSNRMIEGAGKAIIGAPGEVVNLGSELLLAPVLGKDAAAQPGALIKGAEETLNKGVETGVKLLEGLGGGLLGK